MDWRLLDQGRAMWTQAGPAESPPSWPSTRGTVCAGRDLLWQLSSAAVVLEGSGFSPLPSGPRRKQALLTQQLQ